MKWALPVKLPDRIIFMADGEVLVDTTDVDDFFRQSKRTSCPTIPQQNYQPRK